MTGSAESGACLPTYGGIGGRAGIWATFGADHVMGIWECLASMDVLRITAWHGCPTVWLANSAQLDDSAAQPRRTAKTEGRESADFIVPLPHIIVPCQVTWHELEFSQGLR